MIFWNHGEDPIFISRKIKTDPLGVEGKMESKLIIPPGGGIDISILNLRPEKPPNKGTPHARYDKNHEGL